MARRMLMAILLLMLTSLAYQGTVFSAPAPPTIKVMLNGTPVAFDVSPVNIDGRVMVPVRAIAEALGATVEWLPETRTVLIYRFSPTDVLALRIGSTNYWTLAAETPGSTDRAPAIVNGRTLVPVRLVSTFLGASVHWQGNTSTVHLSAEVFSGPRVRLQAHEAFASRFRGSQPQVADTPHGKTPILGLPEVSADSAARWAKSRGATAEFVSLAHIYWARAVEGGARPDVAYAQAAKETGFGRFGGVIDASFRNLCGLKASTSGDGTCETASAYHRFASWEEGIDAHLHHLDLYAGRVGTPYADTPDPRHFPYLKGTVLYVEDLGGKWAMNPNYGIEIVKNLLEPMKQFEKLPGK